jgi:AI-2 transport protein TqsA
MSAMASAPSEQPQSDDLSMIRACAILTAGILSAFALWALRQVLTPLLLAVFLLMVINGLERVLSTRTPLPRRAILPAAIIVVITLFGLSFWLIAENGAHIVAESGGYVARLDALLKLAAQRLGLQAAPSIDEMIHQLAPEKFVAAVAGAVGDLAEKSVLVLIYLGFLIAARAPFRRKLATVFGRGRRAEALSVLGRVQNGVEGYIFLQTVIGALVAIGSAVIMYAMGLSHVLFWAFLIFLANYIPVIGVAIGVLVPTLFGMIELDAIWKPIVIFVAMEVVHFVAAHVILPRMQGQRLNMDPLVVLLSLTFWGVLFGLAGAFLSTPLTVLVMAVCAEFPATQGVAVMLSADGRPFSEEGEAQAERAGRSGKAAAA